MSSLRARAVMLLLAGLAVLAGVGAAGDAGAQQRPQPSPGPMHPGAGTMPGGMGDVMGDVMGPGMMGPGGMMGPRDRPWITIMLDRRQELGLSAEQVGKLFDLRDGFQRVAREKSQELAKAEEELGVLLGPQPVDLAAVEARLKAIEARRTDLRLSRLKTIEEAKRLLTPEQQKKLVAIAEQLEPSTERGSTGPGPRQ